MPSGPVISLLTIYLKQKNKKYSKGSGANAVATFKKIYEIKNCGKGKETKKQNSSHVSETICPLKLRFMNGSQGQYKEGQTGRRPVGAQDPN